jgi:hypothetical protein
MAESDFIEHQGKLYARVSAVIRSPGQFDHIQPAVLAKKAQLGTDVHAAISAEMTNDFYPLEQAGLGYLRSFNVWREALKPTFVHCEQRYFCDDLMISGQIDAIVRFDEGPLVLVDYKTSVSESKITWPRQGELYHHLLAANKIECSRQFLFIRLNKFGDLPVVHQYTSSPSVRAECLQLVRDFWIAQKISIDLN